MTKTPVNPLIGKAVVVADVELPDAYKGLVGKTGTIKAVNPKRAQPYEVEIEGQTYEFSITEIALEELAK